MSNFEKLLVRLLVSIFNEVRESGSTGLFVDGSGTVYSQETEEIW